MIQFQRPYFPVENGLANDLGNLNHALKDVAMCRETRSAAQPQTQCGDGYASTSHQHFDRRSPAPEPFFGEQSNGRQRFFSCRRLNRLRGISRPYDGQASLTAPRSGRSPRNDAVSLVGHSRLREIGRPGDGQAKPDRTAMGQSPSGKKNGRLKETATEGITIYYKNYLSREKVI